MGAYLKFPGRLTAGSLLMAATLALAQTPSGPPDPATDRAELRATTQQQEAEIARLEAEYGTYDPRVGEQLLSQGRAYQQLNEPAKAVEALTRAFHIRRVNDGLYSLGNAPILQSIIAAEIDRQNWDAVDRSYDHLLWIYQRNYQEGDQQLLSMYDKVGRWKIKAYREQLLDASPYATISAASDLYAKTIELTEARHGATDPKLIDLLYGHALASYHTMIEYANRPLDEYVDRQGGGSVTYVQQCYPIRLPNGRTSMQCVTVPVTNVGAYARAQQEKDFDVRQRFQAARRSLERVIEIYEAHPELPVAGRAAALAHVGDWYMMSRHVNSALTYYQKAWSLLQSSPDGQVLLPKMFGEPVALPALRLSVDPAKGPAVPESTAQVLTLAYDVTKDGRVRNARLTDKGTSNNVGLHRKALKNLRSNRFRPRLENGVPVDSIGLSKRVRVSVD
jgi:hypothetical protein